MSVDLRDFKTIDYIALFKIIENEYAEKTAKEGQMYFNTLSYFRTAATEKGRQAVGDATEACLTHKVEEYIVFEDEMYQIHGKSSGYNVRISNNQCVYCLYAVEKEKFKEISENKYRYIIPYSTLSEICADKGGIENCSIIAFSEKILYKLQHQLTKRNFSHAGGKISYDDFEYVPKHDINSFEYSLESAFHKEKKYSYQNEFRIVTINSVNSPIDKLTLSLSSNDFCVIPLKDKSNFCCDVDIDIVRQEGKERYELIVSGFLSDI